MDASYALIVIAISISIGFVINGLMAGGRFSELEMRLGVLEKVIDRQASDISRILAAFHRLLSGIQNAPDLKTAQSLALEIAGEVFAKPVTDFAPAKFGNIRRNP
jgi:hypothetical protein